MTFFLKKKHLYKLQLFSLLFLPKVFDQSLFLLHFLPNSPFLLTKVRFTSHCLFLQHLKKKSWQAFK